MKKKTKKTVLSVKDHKNGEDMLMHIDWRTRAELRVIETKIGDKTYEFDKGELWKALFIISNEDEKEQMLPKMSKTRTYKKRVTIEADKDIKKGERLIFTVDWQLPEAVLPDDVLAQNPDGTFGSKESESK